MNNFRFLLIFTIIGIGCHRTFYSPTMPTTPIFTQKNEIEVTGGTSIGAPFRELTGSVAWSPIQHIGLFASGTKPILNKKNQANSDTCCWDARNSWEIGGGYYKKFEKDYFFQVYAGGGKQKIGQGFLYPGQFGFFEPIGQRMDTLVNFTSKTTRFYINPSIGFYDKNVQIFASLPIVRFICVSNQTRLGANVSILDKWRSGDSFWFVEPNFGIRVGWEKFMYYCSGSISNGIGNGDGHNFGHISVQQSLMIRLGHGIWSEKWKGKNGK